MSKQQFDLETLNYILNHCGKDVTGDSSKLLTNLIKSTSESTLNKSLSLHNKEAFSSVNVLLNLFEKLVTSNKSIKFELPVDVIIQSIRHILCGNENFSLPDGEIQCSILSVVSSLFRISLIQNSQENLEKLSDFYVYLVTCLTAEQGSKSDWFVFKLKIVKSIYHALTLVSNEEFRKKIELKSNLDECTLFTELVLHQNEDVAIETLMCLIPEYVNCFESDRIVKVTWWQISDLVTAVDSSSKYNRMLIILCFIFDICFERANRRNLTALFLENKNYWKLLQCVLVEKDPMKKKQGMYLLKKSLELLNNSQEKFVCNDIFYWSVDCKDKLYEIYSEIIISLEYLDEQQVHIIKPMFSLIETLGKKITECGKVNFSWILLLWKKALMHESKQIVLWGLDNFLKLPEKFFLNECIASETIVLLVGTLNNMSLYYNNGEEISQKLRDFFNRISCLPTSRNLLRLCIKEICSHVWSAEALFFVVHSLSPVKKFSFWGVEEISIIEIFISKAFITHNKVIRTAIQCRLLSSIMAFTDRQEVGLEKIVLLVSKLCVKDLMKWGRDAWDNFVTWVWETYSQQEVEDVLIKYKENKLGEEFSEKFLSFMFILCSYHYEGSFVLDYLREIILEFKDIDKRLYCDKTLCEKYLSVICNIYEFNLHNPTPHLVKPTLVLSKELLHFINTEFQNFCPSYINSFEVIIKTLLLFKTDIEVLDNLCLNIVEETETLLNRNCEVSSTKIFWRIKQLSLLLELYPFKKKFTLLNSYLLNNVNEPLMIRKNDESEKTTDSQTLRGRMNSEFLEGKWKILNYLIRNKLIMAATLTDTAGIDNEMRLIMDEEIKGIGCDGLMLLCLEALNTGGYGVLCPVIDVLKEILPDLENHVQVKNVVEAVWKLMMERRKTEEFKLCVKHFVEMLYQEVFIAKGKPVEDMLFEYADFIFSDTSLTVVNIFMKHIQQINLLRCSLPLFCHIVGRGLIFGPVPKKDEILTSQVYHFIEFENICLVRGAGVLNIRSEIRARAVSMILMLDKTDTNHRTAGKNLIETLLKLEKEINKKRTRYFANSQVHRVKHRLLQALLLLEPMLNPDEEQAKELSVWLYRGLLTENSQPSVRYQQEWLLVRMLLRHPELYHHHWICNYNMESVECSKRGLCSVIAVTYHLCKLSPVDLMEDKIAIEIQEIFSLCFHQHFEVRLYAQVVFYRLFEFCQRQNLIKLVKNFEYIYQRLKYVFEENLKGNFSKNLEKRLEDLYFTEFDPAKHYSLETIYMDLPKLTKIGSDELISPKMFQYCGVDVKNINLPLENSSFVFKNIGPHFLSFTTHEKSLSENSDSVQMTEENSEVILSNYQKKIIPNKSLVPGLYEKRTIRKDGLVVVASLIDRIPNLGGLARTCEIFGASEYVVNSLKYIEDKQFTSLSVTAEKWINVKEVKTQNLINYIFEMKLDGYTIIGAEQTLHSVPLGSAKFPRKSLLLLGNEKEGIPPNLLPLLDICVEIPQLGIIRSLNVHVTGALFIWEYAKQNNFV